MSTFKNYHNYGYSSSDIAKLNQELNKQTYMNNIVSVQFVSPLSNEHNYGHTVSDIANQNPELCLWVVSDNWHPSYVARLSAAGQN